MMLMDCEDLEGTLREAVRVLKPSGRLFASVLHPCFDGNHDIGIGRQGIGLDRQVVVKNYFEPKEWEAPLWLGTIPVIWRHRTLEEYVKTFIKVGFTIVDMNEPRASDEQAKKICRHGVASEDPALLVLGTEEIAGHQLPAFLSDTRSYGSLKAFGGKVFL